MSVEKVFFLLALNKILATFYINLIPDYFLFPKCHIHTWFLVLIIFTPSLNRFYLKGCNNILISILNIQSLPSQKKKNYQRGVITFLSLIIKRFYKEKYPGVILPLEKKTKGIIKLWRHTSEYHRYSHYHTITI